MTLNPLGTFGTGYDTSNNVSRLNVSGGSGKKSGGGSSGSASSGSSANILPPNLAETPKPDAIPSFSYTVKADRRVDFTNKSLNAVRYLWTFGNAPDGSVVGVSSHKNPIFFYPDIGGGRTYTVTLRAYNTDGNFEETTSQVFVEHLDPECEFSFIVSGTLVRFTNLSTDITEGSLWTFGDNETSTEDSPHHVYDANGSFTVKLTKGSFTKTYIVTIDTEVVLDCDDVSGATGYKWEYSTDGIIWEQFADTVVSTVGVTEAVYGIDSTDLNYFRVRAYNAIGDSDYSNTTSVRCN